MIKVPTFLITLFFGASISIAQTTGDVTIIINEIKNQGEGVMVLMLFSSEDGFPMDSEKASFKAVIQEFGESLEYTFVDVPFGRYALAAFQDKNRNGKVDTRRLVPIPKEPVGALNVTKRSRPKFEDSLFEVNAPLMSLSLTLINQ